MLNKHFELKLNFIDEKKKSGAEADTLDDSGKDPSASSTKDEAKPEPKSKKKPKKKKS